MNEARMVLLHGAWHGPWCWDRLGRCLDARGLAWSAPQLPSAGGEAAVDMGNDVTHLRSCLEDLGPVVVVAHSYAGAVITQAAPWLTNVRSVIYLAALVPREGQTASDVTKEYGQRSPLDATIRRDEGLLTLDPIPAALALYGDCDAVTRADAISRVTTQTLASFRTPRTSGRVGVPTTYIVCQRDQAIVPEVQRDIARRCDHVVEMASDHSPFWSRPAEFAELLSRVMHSTGEAF